jgi:glycosyltransferase involved in cell wall biosynthesis
VIITMLNHGFDRPVGAVTTRYEIANGLARRGHDVVVVHFGTPSFELDQVSWFEFDPRLRHHLSRGLSGEVFPESEFVFSASLPLQFGWPVQLFQGLGFYAPDEESAVLRLPGPKLCISRWLVKRARERGAPPEHLVHVPLGLDHSVFRVTRDPASRPLQVSMITHTDARKGTAYGLAALEEVRRRVPEVRVVLFGSEEPVDPLPAWAEFHLLPERDVLVDEIYNGSRVFVNPSLREGFGKPSVEAMACGAALVTVANLGSAEFAVRGETALVCPRRDPAALTDAVERLLRDDAQRLALAEQGRTYVERFDWDETARRIEEVLVRYRSDPALFGLTALA